MFPNTDKLEEVKVKSCDACLVTTPECKREPKLMPPLPEAPWKNFSRYPVVEIVKSTAATTVILKLDKVFSEFGVPDVIRPG